MLKRTCQSLDRLGLDAPTLLVDESRARANIDRMAAKALASGVRFRPHFKTHRNVTAGRWLAWAVDVRTGDSWQGLGGRTGHERPRKPAGGGRR